MAKTLKCSECGATISEKSLYCSYCGAALAEARDLMKKQSEAQIKNFSDLAKLDIEVKQYKMKRNMDIIRMLPIILVMIFMIILFVFISRVIG